MNPHIQLFLDMMQECYGVNGWIYDRDLNVQFTNSKSPNLQKLLLLGSDRDTVTAKSGDLSDTMIIRKVEKANPDYRMASHGMYAERCFLQQVAAGRYLWNFRPCRRAGTHYRREAG